MIDDRAVRKEILQAGLRGLFTVPQLLNGQLSTAPDGPGVYTVWRTLEAPPRFARKSTAGHYKGKDPSIDVEELQARWVPEAALLYLGKSANLRTRVRVFIDFASGKPVAHWDGRALWQLSDADELLVAWSAHAEPTELYAALLERFQATYQKPWPFANEGKRG